MKETLNKYTRNNSGFTLVELLIALALSMLVIGSLSGVFITQRKAYDVQDQVTEMTQNVRAAMEMITREVRMAGFDTSGTLNRDDPNNANFVGIAYDTSQLRIYSDLSGNQSVNDSNERIAYAFYNSNSAYPNQIRRRTGGGAFQPFAENIENFTFEYLDNAGNPTNVVSDIRQVELSITGRTTKEDPNYSHPTNNDGHRRYTLTSIVTPPNLDL